MSGIYKGLSGLALFVSVPVLLKYLGNENYGLWILVFTLFQLVLMMDFGIQSSLKTKIPELIESKNHEAIKFQIKLTYKITFCIAIIILIVFIGFIYITDLKQLLKISNHGNHFIKNLFTVNVIFFCLNFFLNIHKSLYVAFLKGKYAEESLVLTQFLFLFFLVLAFFFLQNLSTENKLLFISLISGISGLGVNLYYTFRFFKMENLNLKTTSKLSSNYLKELLLLGSKYMFLQIGLLFVFSADNYIISNNFSPKNIVAYDSINKLFQLPIMIFFAVISPLWSVFTKDFVTKNQSELYRKFKIFNRYFIAITIFIAIFAFLTPFIISIWIKTPFVIPNNLIFYLSLLTVFRIFVSYYAYFLYGTGKLNNYILIILFSVVLKLPLSYYFIQIGFGINSVVLSTLIILLFWVILIPYECYIIVRKLNIEKK